ncbi:MAG: hypothetical protein IH594_06435, partial [Bacteroidales bacterium]|nr:hypothetical protein [Bacteroidales bacterium]
MKQFFGIGLMLVVLAHSNLGYSQSNRNHDDNGHGGFEYFIGIVGTPTPGKEEIDWSDQSLEELKDLGVNMLQLSVAFGWRPANEVLNMEDLNEEQIIMWKYRIKQAEKHGFKTIAHFGIPRWLNDNPVKPACILDQEIRDKYVHLISEFMTTFPEVNDILVYTYDQRAWLCSEFGPCPRCTGIPLSDRLPDFLNLLTETMQKARPGNKTMLWWKPWEISKGQTIDILNKIDPKGFGLMLNSSTSNEGYPFNDGSFKSDLGVKRFVQLAYELNIPVIGEFQHTFYKPLYMVDDYFPRLIYEQMNGWKEMEGVIGVKEYYGFAPSTFSVNYSMLKEWMKTPNASLEELLNRIAAPYGKKSAPCMIKAWEYVAQAVEAMPWDVPAGIGGPNSKVEHNWTPVKLGNASFDTPLWKANRKSYFMLTGDKIAHPWIIEDAGIRFKDASKLEFRAVEYFDKAIAEGERMVDNIQMQRDHIELT